MQIYAIRKSDVRSPMSEVILTSDIGLQTSDVFRKLFSSLNLYTGMKKLITIFGPSECLSESPLYKSAESLGTLLAEAGFAVVTGGYEGVMEAASKGAHSASGTVIGITAEVYFNRGREPNSYLTKEIKVKSATDRLMELLDLSDAYIACGISPGTLTEVSIAWDYIIKKFIEEKPIIFLGNEWKSLCEILFLQDGYKGKEHIVSFAATPEDAVGKLLTTFGKQELLPDLTVLQV
jgi:uncharacterized protein (TIGR00725 family)